ncbi:MAG: HlyD family efflux transporter periplasmic adaptor subunit [Nannocystaceae bacterium]|jgi:multidrug efflux pump subunit AcrA (membrane-fusion protein)
MPAPLSIDELDEILTARPGRLLRWGSALIGAVALLLVLLAWFIEYPDVVPGRVTLLTENPPAPVLARTEGLIDRLDVRDGDCVEQGQVLARIATTGDGDAILALGKKLAQLEPLLDQPRALAERLGSTNANLGTLHASYLGLQAALEAHEQLVAHDVDARISTLQGQQRDSFDALRKQLGGQIDLLSEDVALAEARHRRDRTLSATGALAERETEGARSEVLRRRIDLGLARLEKLGLLLQLAQTESDFLDIDVRQEDERRERAVAVKSAFRQLQLEYFAWEAANVLVAPIGGCVSMSRIWSDHQAVHVGDEVLSVLPPENAVVGRVQLAQASAGKVAVGQRVMIQLDSFPMYEFGVLEGHVASISAVGDAEGFAMVVELDHGMTTDQGVRLQFRQGMAGNAKVVTQQRRILTRVFAQVYDALMGDRANV